MKYFNSYFDARLYYVNYATFECINNTESIWIVYGYQIEEHEIKIRSLS